MKSIDIIRKRVYCKSCFKPFNVSPIRKLIERNPFLCDECISLVNKKLEVKNIIGIKTFFLSDYDGQLKRWLMNYKEYGDIELAGCFLYIFLPLIKVIFNGYIFVPVPSSKERIDKRGFEHLPCILEASNIKYKNILKIENIEERKNIKGSDRLKTREINVTDYSLRNKKIVIFDDVMTTSQTFKESVKAIKKIGPKKVKGLIMMNNLNSNKVNS